ncbi:MAG: FecR family protein [Chitinophagaceae bacterium]|nr:FecR family protein [Chitinophagaceae bacterium]
MSQENFWILFSKKVANEATPEELAELEKLIQQHPEWQYAIQNLQDIWHADPVIDHSPEEDAYLLHLQRMKEKNIPFTDTEQEDDVYAIHRRKKTRLRIIYSSVAIAASLLIGFFVFIKPKNDSHPGDLALKEISEISTRLGSKSRIQLPDGSIVWINAGSKLIYHKDFGQTTREVELSGEAFFDVVKDKTRPFLIHTKAIDIRVLGTSFNVKAYPDDKTTETSLIRGSIEVSIKRRPDNKVILSPNEKLVVENEPKSDSVNVSNDKEPLVLINKLKRDPRDSTIAEMQWTENKLAFDDEPFKDIAIKMERWFNIEIEISDTKLAGTRLTGKFDGESVEQALEGLAYASRTPFVFERKGNKIFIHR